MNKTGHIPRLILINLVTWLQLYIAPYSYIFLQDYKAGNAHDSSSLTSSPLNALHITSCFSTQQTHFCHEWDIRASYTLHTFPTQITLSQLHRKLEQVRTNKHYFCSLFSATMDSQTNRFQYHEEGFSPCWISACEFNKFITVISSSWTIPAKQI